MVTCGFSVIMLIKNVKINLKSQGNDLTADDQRNIKMIHISASPSRSLSLPRALSLSLSLALSFPRALSLSLPLALFLSPSRSLSLSQPRPLPVAQSHFKSHTIIYIHLSHMLCPSPFLPPFHTYTHKLYYVKCVFMSKPNTQ